ncbi:NAD(P)-dependent oxidoreductase [Hymenobacter taeanensis]|uniref:NAD(P)-dependent oxidoreductase n=1 Tax=Hymenobacter taeanensis TaxID=2735321 RepID=A0A6M6BLR1_9BACT|nr:MULTISPECIES: NAD(P)-dependent oxidoreductase [Hymenobacter]QJX48393.1 NAD(P)-dependent oxidoreductase [Hymenobacter taeanensis]UOQ82113.1 NAD(P)-dependent oxidoreductase [Hymenobacter sp. 5414T-23]
MSYTVAFLGLGSMGLAMATNLLKAGYQLTVYNRTASKADELQAQGATVATTPAEAVQDADFVFTMVTDDAALQEICTGPNGILPAMKPGAIHASCSTVAPDTNRRLADAHTAHGSHLLATPVFGKPDVAAAGKLWLASAGADAAAREKTRPLLEALGQGVHDFGDDPGAASVVKLCGNFMLGAAIEAMAEAFTLAQKSGLDRQQVYEFFTSTIFNTPIYKSYGKLVAERHYQPVGAPPAIIRKDMRLVLDESRAQTAPMPFANIIHDNLSTTVAKNEQVDWAGFAERAAENAGL